MIFDRYAGYTVCAPSRTALFTGRHLNVQRQATICNFVGV